MIFGGDAKTFWNRSKERTSFRIYTRIIEKHTNLPIPTILQKHVLNGRKFVSVEKLTGNTLQSFIGQSDSILFSLGKGLAEIHSFQAAFIGNPSGTFQVPLEEFKSHILKVSKELVNRFYSDNASIRNAFPTFEQQLASLPVPREATLVLIDMDPTQFLSDGSTITSLVDTEAYAIAPREFEFIGLEYVLTEKKRVPLKVVTKQLYLFLNLKSVDSLTVIYTDCCLFKGVWN